MKEYYSQDEAIKLAQYYLPLVRGKIIEESTQSIIISVEIEGVGNSKFSVEAFADYNSFTRVKRSIAKVAALHGLASPTQVLQDQDQ